MCDYSLMEFPNRLAVEGEILVVHRFRSGSLGLAAPADCCQSTQPKTLWKILNEILFLPEAPKTPAVCIPPGARLILHDVPARLQKELDLSSEEEVKFVQLSATENQHRDAVLFRNGAKLRLQELSVGQRVEVVDLGNSEFETPEEHGTLEAIPVLGPYWRS